MTDFKDSKTRHGTTSGWSLHQKRSERPCDACYQAKASYDRTIRDKDVKQRRIKVASRAQAYANKMLKQSHPEEYREYYLQSKEQQEEGF